MDQLADHNIIIQPMHVRGHQDKHKTYHQLTRAEQLNVDADGEATAALRLHSKTDTYHMPEYAKTMLYIDGQPITSNEAKAIRTAYLSKNLRQHLTQREHWHDTVPDMIHWEAHQRSLNKLNKTDTTRIHKFLHRCLPTNKKLHDFDATHPAKCPACNSVETNDHVTTCPSTRREKLRREMRTNVSKMMDKYDTHPHIKECIIIGITKIFKSDTSPILPTDLSFTPAGKIHDALAEQHDIGWLNFYRGRISTKWITAQADHAQRNNNQTKRQDSTQWASQLITTMWHSFLQIWEERKQDQHGREASQQHDRLRENLLKRTVQLYQNIHQYDDEDKVVFAKPVAHWEQATNKDIQDWLSIAEPLADKSSTRAATRIRRNQPVIQQFFRATNTRETIPHHDKTHNRRPPRVPRGG